MKTPRDISGKELMFVLGEVGSLQISFCVWHETLCCVPWSLGKSTQPRKETREGRKFYLVLTDYKTNLVTAKTLTAR